MLDLPPVLGPIPEAGFDNVTLSIPYGAIIVRQVDKPEAEDVCEDVVAGYRP